MTQSIIRAPARIGKTTVSHLHHCRLLLLLATISLLAQPKSVCAGAVFTDALRNSHDPVVSGILVLSIALIGGVIAFVVVPYMWEHSNSTRSLWQSVCRLERENRRLRERTAEQKKQVESPTEEQEIVHPTVSMQTQPMRYLGAISHRFRSAMNSIMGHSQLLLDQDLTPDQEASVETIYDSSEHLMDIMNDVLDLSRIATGRFEFNRKPFSVEDILDQVGMRLGYQARDKNLEMMCYSDPHLHAILTGDEKRIRQILEVLSQDAVRFTDHGRIDIHSKLLKASQNSQTIRFTVEDTGSMLSDKDRRHRMLETDTEQLENSEHSESSGLEITIIKQLLGLMNSELEVKDRLNGGLCCSFELSLPVALNEHRRLSAERRFPDRRILLAEDNSDIMSFTESLLVSWGVEIDKSEDLESILDCLASAERKEEPFSLLLIDSQLGGLPFSLFNEGILATCAEHDLHAILLSSRPDGTETAEHDRLSILEKPFTASQLNTAIYHVLSESKALSLELEPDGTNDSADKDIRMLIVDDDRVSRELASRILRRAGYQTEVAENGLQAVEMIEKHDFDLVLMDLDMPQMDGFESTKQIRKERGADDLPIIALTANTMDDCADRCYRVGMNDYITKPFQIEKLLNTLNRYKSLHKSKKHSAEL